MRRAPWPPVVARADGDAALGPHVAELAQRLREDVAGSVGIVCAPERLDALRAALAGVDYADATRDALGPGLNLLDLHVVKGLEFDAAVVVEPAEILDARPDGGRGGLYTALTRSTRALAIVHAAPLPAALQQGDHALAA